MAKIPNLEAIRDWCKQKFQPKGNYVISSDVKNGRLTIRKNGNDVGYFYANQESDSTIDIEESDTWEPNTKEQNGYVEKGNGHSNKVWKTDENGNPGWRDEAFLESNVTGVKGNKEQLYRTGNVNLTPSNIGAVSTSGDTMIGKLNAHGGISLNGSTTSSNIKYILGIDAYADGGTVHYQNANDLSVGKLGGLGSDLFFCARTTVGNFTGDINSAYNNGAYWCQNASNKPISDQYGVLIVQAAGVSDVIKQTYIPYIGNGLMGVTYERLRINSIWSPWRVIETEGSNIVCGNCFYMIDNGDRKRMVLQAIEDGSGANNYGMQLIFGAGGNTFIGSGESASSLYTALQTESNKKANEIYTKGGENMFISADGHLYLYANANAIANRKGICFNAAGELIPVGDSNIFLGTSAFPLGGIGSKSIYLTNNSGGIIFGDESVMISENNNRLSLYAINGVSIDSGILYFGPGTSEKIELANRMLKLSGYNGIQFNSYIRSDICPTDSGAYKLGLSNYRWKEIWCSTSLNTSSDRNLKKNIQDLSSDERYIRFFMVLQPKSYLFKDGTSGRTHVGFISQDVEEAMTECGLTSLEFAGFCKDKVMERNENGTETPKLDEYGDEIYEYSLRYEEFISLNTMMIQMQQNKISLLEKKINKIEEMLEKQEQ